LGDGQRRRLEWGRGVLTTDQFSLADPRWRCRGAYRYVVALSLRIALVTASGRAEECALNFLDVNCEALLDFFDV
jgi:hypothetical protein